MTFYDSLFRHKQHVGTLEGEKCINKLKQLHTSVEFGLSKVHSVGVRRWLVQMCGDQRRQVGGACNFIIIRFVACFSWFFSCKASSTSANVRSVCLSICNVEF